MIADTIPCGWFSGDADTGERKKGSVGLVIRFDLPFKEAKGRIVDAVEVQYCPHCPRLLERHKGNVSAAARAAEKVQQALNEALRGDRAKTNVTKISDLGLVEMTRKRTGESFGKLGGEHCEGCEARGYTKSKVTVCYEIFREIQRKARNAKNRSLFIEVNPGIADLMYGDERASVDALEKRFSVSIVPKPIAARHIESYEVIVK